MKTLLILSSRTTAIGTLRKDSVRELDDSDHRVARVIKNLTSGDNPAAKTLTEKEVKEHAKRIKTLVPKAEGKPATIKVKDAQAGELAANERADKALAGESAALAATEEALSREKIALKASEETLEREAAAVKLADEATSEVEKLTVEKEALAEQFDALQTELATLQKAAAK